MFNAFNVTTMLDLFRELPHACALPFWYGIGFFVVEIAGRDWGNCSTFAAAITIVSSVISIIAATRHCG